MQKDTEIAHKIKEAIAKDERTASLHLSVKVVGGVAFLDGRVPKHEDRDAAAEVAKGVEGVRFVQDRLLVKEEQPSGRDLLEGGERW
jgi:osmotically-inducible protein OsmY